MKRHFGNPTGFALSHPRSAKAVLASSPEANLARTATIQAARQPLGGNEQAGVRHGALRNTGADLYPLPSQSISNFESRQRVTRSDNFLLVISLSTFVLLMFALAGVMMSTR